ncbi:Uncharacterized protein OS=Planctomyces limnophilus (strain ATCC 43296 / DSM 3776 / IFAM 1008 / 290) GN=Plim_0645 PE=4 SV=1 [Gemmataceae bacterium]|nr:Uncharacterized protein OS=Planctomyces limnophilus (strain ATCC 43296 / DSM 3776 / IFAM 1008 / 290) GN=Plim_0645 PE=4 SV=1 [Gemmataceae bacterium]VTT99106.1 Uncharacterized protein OS=Planctomyces limnophilus (strain ATCC 43296 / DSM 3776 / IFAM 1008 / 290) GN=Plim_0645 PE=4 SV=1 [Gemmataceae bacterium]
MARFAAALAALVAVISPANACTFCAGELRAKQTLRMHYAAAKAVLHGQLKNPRFDPKTDDGFTDLQIAAALKDDPARGTQAVVTLRSYLPVVANTPSDYLVFCGVADGKLDPTFGVPATAAVVEYLKTAAKLDDTDAPAKLGFFFKHLDSADATVAADAFFELARAADADIIRAAKQFEPAKLRKLLANPETPAERLGIFAFLLGVSGGPADAAFLAELLKTTATERTSGASGGLLAGYILLAPKDGWALAVAVLGDAKRSYALRLSTIVTVRFFQATRGSECKAEVLKCCAALLPHGDLADQAIEDLRRWGYWELTADVLAQYPKPTHAAPIVRRCIVRYALCCPDAAAAQFVAALRQSDPKLVKHVEEMLELFAPATPPKKNP